MRNFIGVDQSLTCTGLVVLGEGAEPLLQRAVRPGNLRGAERLVFIRAALQDALDRFQPVAAALEGYSYNSTGRTFELGEAGGMVKMAFYDARVPFQVVTPTELKKYVANNHQAPKELMLQRAEEKWKIDFEGEDDVCDAYGLAHILRAIEQKNTVLRHELEVIQSILAAPKKDPFAVNLAKSKITISL